MNATQTRLCYVTILFIFVLLFWCIPLVFFTQTLPKNNSVYCLMINSTTKVFTVSELNSQVRHLLEGNLESVMVEGELSSLACPRSGHWYFTLKDAHAQVRCAMFRQQNSKLSITPANGMLVRAKALISLYEPRGDYQMIVSHMEKSGAGDLQKAFELLKNKLSQEGLFNSDLKKAIPYFPKHLAVITSPTGSAIKDILKVLKRRFPQIPVTIIPSLVQGNDAPAQLVYGIKMAEQFHITCPIDVLIIARGGGSMEDLQPFNDEQLARKIASCHIPIISAIGHETDFTISDFIADLRASTPSVAAELVSPNREEFITKIHTQKLQLTANINHITSLLKHKFLASYNQLKHPQITLRELNQKNDDLEMRLITAIQQNIHRHKQRLNNAQQLLSRNTPNIHISQVKSELKININQIQQNIQHYLEQKRHQLSETSAQLQSISPLATMSRGYSIVKKGKRLITSSHELAVGDTIETKFHKGVAICKVNSIM